MKTSAATIPDLLPCAHCKGEADLRTWRIERERRNPAKVFCTKCGMSTPICDRIKDAVKIWNTRV